MNPLFGLLLVKISIRNSALQSITAAVRHICFVTSAQWSADFGLNARTECWDMDGSECTANLQSMKY